MSFLRTPQVVAAFQEEGAYPYSSDESEQTENGISVTSGQTERSPPWAAQEDQSADHGKSAKDESNNGSRPRSCAELPKCIGSNQRSEDKTDDFRPHILDNGRPVKPEGTRNVPVE